jgi:serine/threonine protein kinase
MQTGPATCIECGIELAANSEDELCAMCQVRRAADETPTIHAPEPTPLHSPRFAGAASSSAANSSLTLGSARSFGDYELVEEIARGGMGVVYRARQVSLNRTVALKMILAGQLASEGEVKRFYTEAEAAANLQHPNIVAIHEVGEHEGQHYFSMEYVAGKNLATVVREQPLAPVAAAQCVKAIAEAIQYAHQRGILHRDLKPQNVLIDERGQPRVTDFGLAKLTTSEDSLTQTGAAMGSPGYMPPEQAAGRYHQVGPASDVYSLGAILYQLLTCKPPHGGATPLETLRLVMEQEVTPPSRLNPVITRDLETICLKCLEKEPNRRYATARELAGDLGRFLNHEPILARRANPVRRVWSWFIRHPWIVTGAASLLVLVTVGFAYRMWERVSALEWQHAHPKQIPPFNSSYFLPFWFCSLLFFEFFFFQGVPVSSFLSMRARRQRGLRFYYLFALIGCGQLLFGLEILRRAVATQAWEPWLVIGPVLGSIAALTNVWFGSALAWKALREARLDLPGLDISATPIEHPLVFTNQKTITKAIRLEILGGLGLAIIMAILLQDDTVAKGIFFGVFGMCGVTALVLTGQLILRSRGLERHARLPFLLLALGCAAIGLIGFNARTWYVTVGNYVLGILMGRFLLKRCPLQRGGVSVQPPKHELSLFRRFWRFCWRKGVAYCLGIFLGLIVVFYLVENWRGVRAWNQTRSRLEQRGQKIAWPAYVSTAPARVADAQNAFKHPFMQQYGVRHGMSDSARDLHWLDPGFVGHGLPIGPPIPMATLKTLPRERTKPVTLTSLDPTRAQTATAQEIAFHDLPLARVVESLAEAAGIRVMIDSEKPPLVSTATKPRPVLISITMTNATALAALDALLAEHQLQPELDAASGVYRLTPVYTSLAELGERLSRDVAQLKQLDEAISRPYADLAWDLETRFMELPALKYSLLRIAAQGLATRAKIHLLQGHPEEAFRDLNLMKRIAQFATFRPTLAGAMMKAAIEEIRVETVAETLAESLWPATYLIPLQKDFANVDFLTPWAQGLQAERAFAIEAIRRLAYPWKSSNHGADFLQMFRMQALPARPGPNSGDRIFAGLMLLPPRGWFYQNMASMAEAPDLAVALDLPRRTIDTQRARDYPAQLNAWGRTLSPFKILARFTAPNFYRSLFSVAKFQTSANQAFVACALERHRTAKGTYPETLNALVPEFADKLPHDLFDGQPLRYRRLPDDRYLLYSIGWDTADNGGAPGPAKESGPRANWTEQGDWIW